MLAVLLFSLVAASENESSQGSPDVGSYLKEWNLPCLQSHCAKEVNQCATGTEVCRKRLMCITHDLRRSAKLEKGAGCFSGVDFSHLDHQEVQIVDCAQHMKCAPMNNLGISFLQETMTERDIPTMAQKQSLMQVHSLIQNELSGHMEKAAHAVNLMKSHLTYMDAAGDAVKKTTSLIQEVAKDKGLTAEKKLQALDRLSTHLNDIQQSVLDQHEQLGSLLPPGAASFLEDLQGLGEVPQETGEGAGKETKQASHVAATEEHASAGNLRAQEH